jgi:Flp pilus assembly protein TadG
VIVEFALIVPFLALIVFGVIDFSRAYGQMNALDSALREGGRYGSKWRVSTNLAYSDSVKSKVKQYANAYGFAGLDTSLMTVAWDKTPPEYMTVTVTAHPIPLSILSKFGAPALRITRSIVFRWECAGLTAAQCS